MTVVHTEHNVPYLPLPNTVEVVITDVLAPDNLTRTSFMIPVDGKEVVLATNQRRGIEAAGGHREGNETMLEGAIREAIEETGCHVENAVPIGYLRMTVHRIMAPEGYQYPFPNSYQQFFAGDLVKMDQYFDNDECGQPVKLFGFNDMIQKKTLKAFVCAAINAKGAKHELVDR